MKMMTGEELLELRRAVAGELERRWPSAIGAGEAGADLGPMWKVAASLGWTDLGGGPEALAPLLLIAAELGRVGCPLPVADVHAVQLLLAGSGVTSDVAADVAAGDVRPLVAIAGTDGLRAVDAGTAATHVLRVDPASGASALHVVTDAVPLPGLAAPPWTRLEVAGDPVLSLVAPRDVVRGAVCALRLALVARALGAARRSHALAMEHARSRRQFGDLIGSFQAVQHRLVDAATDLAAGEALLREAGRAATSDDPAAILASELAVTFVAPAARRVQLAAQHTLAAVGYFEEHEAPWLFRRVHADTTRLALFPPDDGDAGDILVETRASLPRLGRSPAAERLRGEVDRFLAAHPGPASVTALEEDPGFVGALADAGYLALGLPPAFGGGADAEQLAVLDEQLSYHRAPAPFARAAAALFGPTIARFGTEEQQQRFLPLIAAGRLRFYLGYSEPDVGSDLGSLTTRAVRDGDEWVVTGTKMWGTGAHQADHVWLAARTDPDADPPHAGITVFLCPTRLPGWSIQRHRALSGEISCTTFFDGVRVSDADRIGDVNGGWKVITSALAAERVVMAGHVAALHRQLDDLLDVVRRAEAPALGGRGSARRARLAALAARLQATRLLLSESIRATTSGGGRFVEAPMAKVLAGDLAEDFADAVLDILGPVGALGAGAPDAPAGGVFEYGLRLAPMYVIGGGTADIQRNLIARGLGLPAS